MLLAAMPPGPQVYQPYRMAYHSKPYSKRLHLCRGWSKLIAAALMMVACACASQVAAQGPEADNKLSAAQMAQALANPDPSGLLQREAELQGWGQRWELHCMCSHACHCCT